MVLEQGALSGKYSPTNPLPEGSNHAKTYNPILPQLKPLTDKLASIAQEQNASASDVATAWALAKGVTPIIGVTKLHYIDGLIRARGIALSTADMEALEALAEDADVNTRGWWEKEM